MQLSRREAIGAALTAAAVRPLLLKAEDDRPVSVILYGTEAPLPRQIALQAGPLSMSFEPELAQLRYIRLGDREVVRAIYAAVRDRNWGTVAPKISNLRTETTDGAFALQFDVACIDGPIDFVWRGTIRGDAAGTVRFEFDGTARSTFLRNRLGFCVLHPVDGCAGQPVVIGKVDGTEQRGAFPADISPHQPFMDIRAIRHAVRDGVEAEVRFEGEVFEMEDHRNWTDASFKTYCTPLGLPFPVEVKKDSTVKQSVTVRLVGKPAGPAVITRTPEINLAIHEARVTPLPQIGLGMSSVVSSLSPKEAERLRALRPAHLRTDLDLASKSWEKAWQDASKAAEALGSTLEVALKLGASPESELKRFVAALRGRKPRVSRYLVFHKDEKSTAAKWMELARKAIAPADPGAKFASGSDAYFTEVNRGRPPVAQSDAVCYSINPQVHAFDNASLVETLPMQAETLRSARKFCGTLPLAISPVTLKPRFNPNATAPVTANTAPPTVLPDEVDARQAALFGAVWTLGSIKYLAEGGAASATYYETVGWRGVMERESGSPLPAQFRSRPGEVFPLYHVLADVGEFAGGEVIATQSSDALRADAILLRLGRRYRLIVANMTPELQHVRTRLKAGGSLRMLTLDRHSAAAAMQNPEAFRKAGASVSEVSPGGVLPVSLLPYATCRVDFSA